MPTRKKPGANGEAAATPAGKKTSRKPAVTRTPPPAQGTDGQPGAEEAPDRGRSNKPDLVIVESPKKAMTINKYLGSGFVVKASVGHVRDLPKRRKKGEVVAGVDIANGWKPTYVVVEREDKGKFKGGKGKGGGGRRSAKEILAELKKEAGRCNRIFLATDPDREGEAIAWHIKDALGLDDRRTFRITFNEITRTAVNHAIAHPGKIHQDRVHAQEARRILDRVVGYPLSGLLGKKVIRGLSAGRVQSVALRLVVDREREIEAFKSEEYWKIIALLAPDGTVKAAPTPKFSVVLSKVKGAQPDQAEDKEKDAGEKNAPDRHAPEEKATTPEGTFRAELAEWLGQKFEVRDQPSAETIAGALDAATYTVRKIEQKDRPEKPQPPFTTSTLQQQASIRLHFPGDRTMRAAQRLYEGVNLASEGLGGPDHLHAHRQHPHLQGGPGCGDQPHRQELRQGLLARQASHLPFGQERPGGSRGHPADRPEVHPRPD